MFPCFGFTGMNLIFNTRLFTAHLKGLTVKSFADVILSTPFIQIRVFRIINTLYFTVTGWTVFYLVWKWSTNAPIIAGKKKKKRSSPELSTEDIEHMLESAYQNILKKMDSKFEADQRKNYKAQITEE
jgi:hypothetical protein